MKSIKTAELATTEETISLMPAIDATPDPYLNEEYADTDASLPRIQVLRGEGNQKPCWFIPQSQLDRSGWLDPEPNIETYHFASGEAEEGLIIQRPRLLVAAKSTILAFDRTASADSKGMVLCGDYRYIPDEDKENYGTVQFFRVYLLGDDNSPLAELPFEFRAKGATRATFAKEWQLNCEEITRHHCRSAGKPFARRNAVYRSLCVFAPYLAKEKVETTKVNVMATKVVGHEKSEPDNWMSFFLGRNENADWYAGVMAAEAPLLSGIRSIGSLPPVEDQRLLVGELF